MASRGRKSDEDREKHASARPPAHREWLEQGKALVQRVMHKSSQPLPIDEQAVAASAPGSRPRLPNARQRVERLLQEAGEHTAVAVETLERLRERFAADAHVLYALALLRRRRGETELAVKTAREAMQICFRQRHGVLAARLFDEVEADAYELGLRREQLVALGATLGTTSEWRLAVRALCSLVMKQPDDGQAIRELANIAERRLAAGDSPEQAWQIYAFLELVGTSESEQPQITQRLSQLAIQIDAG
ncbi:MAG: hypothetical protein JSV80_14520 [Acidobacteriota bacterium]|nr:MAG: hypothetical protein JSV80_14520 [Acidobacteriota bacterium]